MGVVRRRGRGLAVWRPCRRPSTSVSVPGTDGRGGARTSRSGPGAPSGRTTAPTATPGDRFPTITPGPAPTDGTKTGCWASATIASTSRWHSPSGTGGTRSSRSGSSGSPARRATTAKTSRRRTGTSMPPRLTASSGRVTAIRSPSSLMPGSWRRARCARPRIPSTSSPTPASSRRTGSWTSMSPTPRRDRTTSSWRSR